MNISNSEELIGNLEKMKGKKGHSTSLPCGNLVDGLPHACHTKTIAKRARVRPRTQIVFSMKKLFLIRMSSTSGRRIDMIILDYILKIWIELIK